MGALAASEPHSAFVRAHARTHNPALAADTATDSVKLRYKVAPIAPREDDSAEHPVDLRNPSNIKTTIEYDPRTGMYVVRTRIGNHDIVTPYMLSPKEYNEMATRREMFGRFHERNSESPEKQDKKPFNILDMDFSLGPLERVFGPGGVRLQLQGSVQLQLGIKSNKTDNPSLPINSRRRTFFDFDQKIQANINASVGQKMKFNMGYNTDATFDFDSKKLRLAYDGHEDEIIKSIEAGNVAMTTGSSLMRGSTSLFGIKTKLQFGKLTLTGLISQQNSESRSVSTSGGVQTTPFRIKADNYDSDRHFFLAQYFYDHYDEFCSRLPHVMSGIEITRIEVWITNKNSNYDKSRNVVAFMDLGENTRLASGHWTPDLSVDYPSNTSNDLLATITGQYPDARNINAVTQVLQPLTAYGIIGGRDYEKVESARKLDESEYTLNSKLGYISLRSALTTDQVLAVAFEYTANGKVYQVGEFSSDVQNTEQALFLKMLRATTVTPILPAWRLMMKNVYATGATQVQQANFKLRIKYLSDTIGTEVNYLPVGSISNQPLLQVMGLDRIDSNGESNPDGFFDYIEGYTMDSNTGKIIFPVAEPFGANLEKKTGSPALAAPYVYKELYDSTLVVARQFADKNKFTLEGELQASSGAEIRLNAMNVPRGSVIVMAGGTRLTENTDYTVDYMRGIVTITNQSIIDAGTPVNVTLENQSLFSMQRKTLLGLDAQYKFNRDLQFGATIMHYSEKALTEKVSIGDETVKNLMWGVNLAYNKELPWLTNLLNKIPTVNAQAPSRFSFLGEFAQLLPSTRRNGTNAGSSFIDDFETAQSGYDLRSPYSWTLASTPADASSSALFPEAMLSNDVAYGKNRALLSWYFIDRMWTRKNSSLVPGYMKHDYEQLSNPYVREITMREIFRNRELSYGESNFVQTLNLSFYPTERGPYNLDTENINERGELLNPEKRWGGIMRKLDNSNFETANVEYLQFWLLDPFLDPKNPNTEGGDLYFNFGDVSEDILKDGMKSYENGMPVDGNDTYLRETVWGRVSSQNSLTYAFENGKGARQKQDVGLDGLPNDDEFNFSSYSEYLAKLRSKLSAETLRQMQDDPLSPLNDPAGDNYHFYRSTYYDAIQAGILQRYKRYNGVERNSLSHDDADDPLYQPSRSVPDVEDINQDNTLNEYERYFQYKVSIRPEDLEVGKNHITDKQVSVVNTAVGPQEAVWYQFKIPLSAPEKAVGGISDFSTVRFMRMFMTNFKATTHLRFATLELIRGEWRDYSFSLNLRDDTPAQGSIDISTVNIEENSDKTPVNYVLPPGVTRIQDPGQSQAIQLNEQSLAMKLTGIQPGDARGIYKNTQLDLRRYKRLQMWVHAEKTADDATDLKNGDFAMFIRLGSDVKQNYYEYEIPLELTLPGHYNNMSQSDREAVWPIHNFLNLPLSLLTDVKTERNRQKSHHTDGVGYTRIFSQRDPDNDRNTASVLGNPSLSDVRVILIGVRNRASSTKDGEVWINELKVTEFDESGGWAANVNANLALSDIATVNFTGHVETAGFGNIDQPLNGRRLDTYRQYSVAAQGDAGRFAPSKLKLQVPLYYSRQQETLTPKYNPLDQDILLKNALDATSTKQERDSIKNYAVSNTVVESFSLSGLRFGITSKHPMPWDPANFKVSFSFNKRRLINPTTEYSHTDDYRGSFEYAYSPAAKPWRPFSKIKGKNANLNFLREWEFNWIFTTIALYSNISRFYYEEQTRSEVDNGVKLPVQVSKNFYWDRQLNLVWNLTKSLSFSFNSNTVARIEETVGAVNRKLFPDKYREWRDTVWNSIKHLGTPWNYNQTFTASYRAPFSKIPLLNFLNGTITYNSVYRWDRGATVDGLNLGNTIQNQSTWTAEARLNFEGFFNKFSRLREVNKRFSQSQSSRATNVNASNRTKTPLRQSAQNKLRRFERAFQLSADSAVTVAHNLKTRRINVSAKIEGKRVHVKWRVKNDNSIEILPGTAGAAIVTVVEKAPQGGFWRDVADYTLRFAMAPRALAFRWRETHSLNLPLFRPDVGDIFGQTTAGSGPMSPGLDFAFGFFDESYVDKALDRGWLISDASQPSPAVWNRGQEFNFELNLEPIPGLRIILTSNLTDNRTQQIQFMYPENPIIRSGSYMRTHIAIASALRGVKSSNGYASEAFSRFLDFIPQVAERVEAQYAGFNYPTTGFMQGNALAGLPFSPAFGGVSRTSSDVLIPAFLAAYSGGNPQTTSLKLFDGLGAMRPNWRVTYDGLTRIRILRNWFKSITLSHAYQCTFAIGGYSSFLNWAGASGDLGFTLDALTQQPIPSSPYNIPSATITERFAPLAGISATLNNDLTFSAEYRDTRTLSLNSSAGQIVEAATRQFVIGAGYKIVGFNKFLRIRGQQKGVSNDLSLNLDLSVSSNHALIRRIESAYTQATQGTRTFSLNFIASYVLSRRITLAAFFDYQTNTPLISNASYPTSNTNYGLTINMSLAR